ncbi:HAMP domain-containing sensor histidine kinase [Aquirufa aurantiipilula]|uniref:HAMP domain-containing sensor histidine kinase n=1 Tax=Aquirufa aurantiipilula TaxID=2696561 RepID=UPI001CAA65EE|nr:HAMP domain-containing sensor histidine kinase [Aquirufa aurantiipilula]MBZ1326971.1 HAMP domain-containing histidine kinase [Aquirufa aurantiipilula]
MQIRSRLTYQFTYLVSAILFVSYLIIYIFSQQNYKENFYSRLRQKANTAAELLVNVNQVDSKLLRIIDRANRDILFRENIMAYDTCNERIYRSNDTISFHIDVNRVKEVRRKKEVRFAHDDIEILGTVFATPEGRIVVFAGAVDQYSAENAKDLKNILIALFLLFVFIVVISGWFFAGRAVNPISEVIKQVDHLSPKRLEERLESSDSEDEIGKMVSTINRLLERIENAFKLQKTFIANVSHELKNPLTKISSQLEVSLLKERAAEDYKETIASVLEDTQELAAITESLLELNKISVSDYQAGFQLIRIDEIIWEARSLTQKLNIHYKVSIDTSFMPDDEEELMIRGDEKLILTAIKNLMENACKFSPKHCAFVGLRVYHNTINIRVKNEGKGIPKSDLPYIFQPFFRGENTASSKGYGIGLSLVERIIHLHNGSIQVQSNPNEWTEFTMSLPQTKP